MSTELDSILNQATDDTVTFDFSEAKDFAPFSGTYRSVISKVDPGVTKSGKNAGKPNIKWQFTVVEGEHNGRTSSTWTSLNGAGAGRAREIIEAARGQIPERDGTLRVGLSDLIGAEVLVTYKPGVRDGQPTDFSDVVRVRPAPEKDQLFS